MPLLKKKESEKSRICYKKKRMKKRGRARENFRTCVVEKVPPLPLDA